MKKILKVTIVTGLVMAMFTGCFLEDIGKSDDSSSTGTDKLSISKTGEGFLITWRKKSSGYGEVIYTDGTTGLRGNGRAITSNSTGTFFANCTKTGDGIYNCNPSNISGNYGNRRVTFSSGTQYQWLVSSGTDHVHGSVEAVTEYNDNILTIN